MATISCAIFVSGRGTNMSNIIKCVQNRTIRSLRVATVISDNPQAGAIAKAKRLKVPCAIVTPKDFKTKDLYEKHILKILKREKVDFIVLAGYMRIVGKILLRAFPNRILNIHPALLPAFPGRNGISDAYDYGVMVTGVTVHLVDKGIDTGPILLQEALTIKKRESLESLEKRVHLLEYSLYPKAIKMMVKSFNNVISRDNVPPCYNK